MVKLREKKRRPREEWMGSIEPIANSFLSLAAALFPRNYEDAYKKRGTASLQCALKPRVPPCSLCV